MAKKNADDSSNESNVDFESALKELENLVSKMEDGELSLDDSLKAFERGIELTRSCQSSLEKAELRIQILTENDVLKEIDNPSDEH
ncbi:exodeoxyribonuclease VII small subunit [Gammaproteobacteria bacterium]|nr:exodeoxyribonuclease VII small subunit [Gammaproteobacteria bacterium]